MTLRVDEVTGLILAGGRATRMGGVDKGLQLLNGDAMVMHVLRRLQPQVGSVLINANRHLDDYAQFGVPVCMDQIEGFAGPLAGVHAGLAQCRTPYLVTVPCDSPMLPDDLVTRLSMAMERDDSDVAVAVTGPRESLQRHPVFILVKTALLPRLQDFLAGGGRKVDEWLGTLNCAEASFDDEAAFANVNTAAHLADMERRLQ